MPLASCRDCELEEASSSKDTLETFCRSDFGEYLHFVTSFLGYILWTFVINSVKQIIDKNALLHSCVYLLFSQL